MELSLPVSSAVDRLRELLWVGPVAAVALGLTTGAVAGASSLVQHVGLLVDGSASDARTLLVGIVSGLVTALTVVFSLTLVAIQTAGTNYGPRLLRNYLRDGATQGVLVVLLGTVAYCLGVLLGMPADRAPRLAVTVALGLTVAAISAIAYFLSHIAESLRVEAVLARVVRECSRTIDRVVADRPPAEPDADPVALPRPPPGAVVVSSLHTGYLQQVDRQALEALADGRGLHLRVAPARGEQVVAGAPLAWVWPAGGVVTDPAGLEASLHDALDLGFDRTLQQDVGFGFRQVVDVAIKAISPAVNDPYTAVQALDSLEQLLVRLAPHRLGPQVRTTDGGHLVALPALGFDDYLALALDQVRRYGSKEPAVVARVLRLLRAVAAAAAGLHGDALRDQAGAVLEDAERSVEAERDLVALRALAAETLAWVGGDLTPSVEARSLLL